MADKQNIHVTPGDDGWRVQREGAARAIAVKPTQKEAVDRGKEVARNDGIELLVHGRDGQIRERFSYADDAG